MVTVAILTLLGLSPKDIYVGAGIVCAETRGAPAVSQRRVAGVVRNRVAACGQSARKVMLAPRQFAKPCARPDTGYAWNFVLGWMGLGLGDWWSDDVIAFQTHRSARATRWDVKYGWTRVDPGMGVHTFWAGRLR